MTAIHPARRSTMSVADKVQSRHCDRLAIVYVRQSTLQQVERHQESTRLQYGLVERALQFGWSRERVVVIDDDLGRSGAAAAMNPGFQRLVAEVGLGGSVWCSVSRCPAWHDRAGTGTSFSRSAPCSTRSLPTRTACMTLDFTTTASFSV